MSAMRNNDLIKKAVLTLRKAGSTQHEYCKVTIENGRITSIDIRTDSAGGAEFTENVNFAFHKIRFDYTPQGADGQPRGGMSFETEIV
jgi:type VI secretion system secreted protein Hcp